MRTIALVTGIVLAVAFPTAAQHLASRVEGSVQDETGAVIPGASVTLTNADTGVAQETVTDERGLYLFPLVSEGTYRMAARVPGFTTTVVEDVRVGLNAATSIDFVVEIGQVTETVVVAASVAQSQLNTTNAELSTNIFREQVQDLPLNGRNVTQLALTQLGVTGPGGARTASFSGGRGTFNNFTLDGVNNQDT
ncbi:MAG: carboxypeptidase regulatory-like domain-containing protein, partial [Acidobacteria bacterium]|nr:carboxypeptidase regulatory-like domain-containing protein [Acidobacteriota bacterium]